jgi:hypothetical protein
MGLPNGLKGEHVGLTWDWSSIQDTRTRQMYEEEHERDQALLEARGLAAASRLVSSEEIVSRAHALAELMASEGIEVLDAVTAAQVWQAAQRWRRLARSGSRTLLANAAAGLTHEDVLDHIGLVLTDT